MHNDEACGAPRCPYLIRILENYPHPRTVIVQQEMHPLVLQPPSAQHARHQQHTHRDNNGNHGGCGGGGGDTNNVRTDPTVGAGTALQMPAPAREGNSDVQATYDMCAATVVLLAIAGATLPVIGWARRRIAASGNTS